MTNSQPNTTSNGLKQLVWSLPSGAAGFTAGYKAMGLRKQFREWAEQYQVDTSRINHDSFIDYDDHQKKFFRLIMCEETAIMFMLTWQRERPLKITDYPA